MVLVCHVMSQENVIKSSCDSLSRSPSSPNPTKFGGNRHCKSGDIRDLWRF